LKQAQLIPAITYFQAVATASLEMKPKKAGDSSEEGVGRFIVGE